MESLTEKAANIAIAYTCGSSNFPACLEPPPPPSNLPASFEASPSGIVSEPASFSTLPNEIQIQIWSLARPARVIRIKSREVDDKANRAEFIHPGKQACYAIARLPAIFHVNKLSRDVAHQTYHLSFSERLRQPIWFNPSSDIIAITEKEVLDCFMFVAFDPLSPASLEEDDLQFLAVDLQPRPRHKRMRGLYGRYTPSTMMEFKIPEILAIFNTLEKIFILDRNDSGEWSRMGARASRMIRKGRMKQRVGAGKWPELRDMEYWCQPDNEGELEGLLLDANVEKGR